MIAAPPFDAATIAAHEEQAAALLFEFGAYGAERVETAIVQPANVFLDRMGEGLRRRTYVFTGPDGTELCLRPDHTIPTAQAYLASVPRCDRPMKLSYAGPVFRHDPAAPDRPGQFFQAGVESFCEAGAASDVEALLLTGRALKRAGLQHCQVAIGDPALFAHLLTALSLPPEWRDRLVHLVWRPERFNTMLARLSGADTSGGTFLRHIGALPRGEARGVLRDALELGGIKPIGSRSIDEITDRLLERAAGLSSPRLPEKSIALVNAFLDVNVPANRAVETLRKVAREGGVDITAAIDGLAQRFDLLGRAGFDLASTGFSTRFGRNVEYYTGFVFEFRSAAGGAPVASGGRYDNLLTVLGSPVPTPAVGLAVFGDLLAAARSAERKSS